MEQAEAQDGTGDRTEDGRFVRLDAGDGSGVVPRPGQVALVDGALVPMMTFDLPPRLRGQAREDVARRQLRDRLGTGGAGLELLPCPGTGHPDQWQRALVAETGDIATWRAAAGPGARAVLPDYLALPTAPDLWTIYGSGTRVLVRLGLEDGFSAAPEVALAMLEAALEPGDASPKAVLRLGAELPAIDALIAARGLAVIRDAGGARALELEPPVVLGHGEAGADLRRDPQAARNRLRRRVLPWRWTVLAGIAAVALWSAAELHEIGVIEDQTAALRAETEALVRQHFLPTGPILDVRAQVARAMAGPAADTEAAALRPLAVTAVLADVVAASGATSAALTYARGDGLELTVGLTDFSAAARLEAALTAAGMTVTREAAHARASGDGVRAVFAITGMEATR
nr:type II secretion system protein GspL [Shimia biformata]